MGAAIRRNKTRARNGNPMLLNVPKSVSADTQTLRCKGLATFFRHHWERKRGPRM